MGQHFSLTFAAVAAPRGRCKGGDETRRRFASHPSECRRRHGSAGLPSHKQVEFDDDQHIFTGSVINTIDVITFQGESVKELETAFQDSVEDYLAWCKEDGVEPEKPYSGKFNVRFDPAVHQRAAIAAKKQGISLNRFVEKSVEDELMLLQA